MSAASVIGVAAACDAFSPPDPSADFTGDFGVGGSEIFCPAVEFPLATPTAALAGPLFAWITPAERAAIEAGGAVLPVLPTLSPQPADQLATNMQTTLSGLPGAFPLVGQPRIGRNFWTFAFSAPRASEEHNQLLAVWLRADAWFATYGSSYAVLDAQSNGVSPSEVSLSPGRVAGVDTGPFPSCFRENSTEHGFVVFREEAIERIRFGTEATETLNAELSLLRQLLNQVRSSSAQTNENAFDYAECGSTYSGFLCSGETYFQAIAWRTPEYLPTLSALATLIDVLESQPAGADFASDRTSAEDLNEWTAVWPGPWRDGSGGTPGMGGLGGLGGVDSVGGMGGSER